MAVGVIEGERGDRRDRINILYTIELIQFIVVTCVGAVWDAQVMGGRQGQ